MKPCNMPCNSPATWSRVWRKSSSACTLTTTRWIAAKSSYDLPLPLGANVLLRSLDADVKSECCRMMRDSIQYALDNHDEALQYAMQFARDMEPRLAEKFIGMYVNHFTVDCGEIIPVAA